MIRTLSIKSPVLSFLSPSPASARRTQALLQALFSLEPLSIPLDSDELDQTVCTPSFIRKWDSVASKCHSSGAIIHLVSVTTGTDGKSGKEDDKSKGSLSLLAITSAPRMESSDEEAVQHSRHLLASHMKEADNRYVRSLRMSLSHAFGRQIFSQNVLGYDAGLPFIRFPDDSEITSATLPKYKGNTHGLKEIVIPHYDDSVYPDGSTLQSTLSGAPYLTHPAVGLYQWPHNGVACRPLPAAKDDRVLPPPSLVFRSDCLDSAAEQLSRVGASSAKIGFSGLGRNGQLIVLHKDLLGLDIRVTDSVEYTGAFPEAQEALLAASLDELQNVNVMLAGGSGDSSSRAKSDMMNGLGDCWVEFRANMKHPTGFMRRFKGSTKVNSRGPIAKAPDIPYE